VDNVLSFAPGIVHKRCLGLVEQLLLWPIVQLVLSTDWRRWRPAGQRWGDGRLSSRLHNRPVIWSATGFPV